MTKTSYLLHYKLNPDDCNDILTQYIHYLTPSNIAKLKPIISSLQNSSKHIRSLRKNYNALALYFNKNLVGGDKEHIGISQRYLQQVIVWIGIFYVGLVYRENFLKQALDNDAHDINCQIYMQGYVKDFISNDWISTYKNIIEYPVQFNLELLHKVIQRYEHNSSICLLQPSSEARGSFVYDREYVQYLKCIYFFSTVDLDSMELSIMGKLNRFRYWFPFESQSDCVSNIHKQWRNFSNFPKRVSSYRKSIAASALAVLDLHEKRKRSPDSIHPPLKRFKDKDAPLVMEDTGFDALPPIERHYKDQFKVPLSLMIARNAKKKLPELSDVIDEAVNSESSEQDKLGLLEEAVDQIYEKDLTDQIVDIRMLCTMNAILHVQEHPCADEIKANILAMFRNPRINNRELIDICTTICMTPQYFSSGSSCLSELLAKVAAKEHPWAKEAINSVAKWKLHEQHKIQMFTDFILFGKDSFCRGVNCNIPSLGKTLTGGKSFQESFIHIYRSKNHL